MRTRATLLKPDRSSPSGRTLESLAFFLLLGFGAGAVPVPAAQDVPALIKRQSQQFSDASASGDAAVLGRLLDKDVVFINESGAIGSKKDVVESAGPPPVGVSNKLVQTDFVCRVHGPVAVTSFTDSSTVDLHD